MWVNAIWFWTTGFCACKPKLRVNRVRTKLKWLYSTYANHDSSSKLVTFPRMQLWRPAWAGVRQLFSILNPISSVEWRLKNLFWHFACKNNTMTKKKHVLFSFVFLPKIFFLIRTEYCVKYECFLPQVSRSSIIYRVSIVNFVIVLELWKMNVGHWRSSHWRCTFLTCFGFLPSVQWGSRELQ